MTCATKLVELSDCMRILFQLCYVKNKKSNSSMELSNEPNIDLMKCENACTIDAVHESVLESTEFCLLMTCESDDEESDDIGPSTVCCILRYSIGRHAI